MTFSIPKLWPAIVTMFITLLCFLAPAWAGNPAEFTVYVMDADKKLVQSVSMPSGTVSGSSQLTRTPGLMTLTPDGSRLLVFERGDRKHLSEGRAKGSYILRLKEPNSLSIFDTRDMKLVARLDDIGWNAVAFPAFSWPQGELSAAWDSSGKLLTLLVWGSGEKHKNPEIIQVDVTKGSIAGRWPLHCEPGEVNPLLQISPNRATVLYGKRDLKNKADATHTILFIDLSNLANSKEVSLPGIPRDLARSSDADHVFVLADQGVKSKERGEAHLHIVSTAQRSLVRSIDAGFYLSDAVVDQNTGLTLISRMSKDRTSVLMAFRGDQQMAEIEIPDVALDLAIAPKTQRLYILCYNSIQVVDLQTLKLAGSISAPHRKRGFLESGNRDRPPSTLAFNADESLAVLGFSGDDESSVLDLKNFRLKGTIDIISGARAFGAMVAVAMASHGVVSSDIAPNYASSIVDPSAQFVYILGPGFVHGVNLTTYKRISSIKLGFFPQYAYTMPAKDTLMFVAGYDMSFTSKASYKMAVIDMAAREKLSDVKWLGPCLYTSDQKHAINYDSENLHLLDGVTLTNLKTVGGFKELSQILLAPQPQGISAEK